MKKAATQPTTTFTFSRRFLSNIPLLMGWEAAPSSPRPLAIDPHVVTCRSQCSAHAGYGSTNAARPGHFPPLLLPRVFGDRFPGCWTRQNGLGACDFSASYQFALLLGCQTLALDGGLGRGACLREEGYRKKRWAMSESWPIQLLLPAATCDDFIIDQ